MTRSIALLSVCAVLVPTARVLAQQPDTKPAAPQQQAMADMAKWMELNALGPEHEKFKHMVGTWDTEMKMWMAHGTPPIISQGSAEFRMIFDGRFIEQRFKCPMMGMAFEGVGIEGYDRFKKKYVSMWFDNSSNGIYLSEGTEDADGKSVTYYGAMDDPMSGERNQMMRSVAREIDDDKVVFEMYTKRAGMDEFKHMEITYTRPKPK